MRCASSTTATSTILLMSAISTVHATCLAPSTGFFSWPVIMLHGTPSRLLSPSATSHASSRSGEQYTPLSAALSCWRAE